MKRILFVLLFLFFSFSLEGAERRFVWSGTEAEASAFTPSQRAFLVIIKDASSATDCDFSSGTGDFMNICLWCDGTSSWVNHNNSCVASAADFLLLDGGIDFLLLPGGVDKMELP